tara:strand:- start:203 stop:958 length:756 start_codon:yes stop_codon:yes gene_type:complete
MKGYFSYFPVLNYVSRMTDRSSNDEYIRVKNIFRRPKIRDDMMSVVTAFNDYMILGNKRPEEVAMDVYGDPRLDWVILISNNITRLRDEWPLTDVDFQKYAIEKYGSEEKLQEVHHYVTQVMFDDNRRVVIPEGLVVDSNFDSRYLERNKARQEEVTFAGGTNLNPIDSIDNSGTVKDSSGNVVIHNNILPITNYEFEEMENDAKRRIKIIKDDFLDIIMSDMQKVMKYKKSSQFITRREKWAYNPRLSGQ